MLASRLATMQAQVEPRFLFNALAQIESLYDRDPERADDVLDDLIAYLRAALPQLRGGASTLGREAALAESYLRVIRTGTTSRLEVTFDIPIELWDAVFPPMVLLPLINHAIVRVPKSDRAVTTVCVSTELHDSKLRLMIANSCVDFVLQDPDGAAIHSICERLSAPYGKDASLEVERSERRGTRAVIELPSAPIATIAERELLLRHRGSLGTC